MLSGGVIRAQEPKPVPKDSVRVVIPGCSKGRVFTAGLRTEEHPGSPGFREGTHLRMNGPKAMMAEIKRHEGSQIEISGLMRKDDVVQDGVRIGPVRITPGATLSGGGSLPSPVSDQIVIDVEGFQPIPGDCPRR